MGGGARSRRVRVSTTLPNAPACRSATVSRVLRGSAPVAVETRRRVLAAADDLQWRPSGSPRIRRPESRCRRHRVPGAWRAVLLAGDRRIRRDGDGTAGRRVDPGHPWPGQRRRACHRACRSCRRTGRDGANGNRRCRRRDRPDQRANRVARPPARGRHCRRPCSQRRSCQRSGPTPPLARAAAPGLRRRSGAFTRCQRALARSAPHAPRRRAGLRARLDALCRVGRRTRLQGRTRIVRRGEPSRRRDVRKRRSCRRDAAGRCCRRAVDTRRHPRHRLGRHADGDSYSSALDDGAPTDARAGTTGGAHLLFERLDGQSSSSVVLRTSIVLRESCGCKASQHLPSQQGGTP